MGIVPAPPQLRHAGNAMTKTRDGNQAAMAIHITITGSAPGNARKILVAGIEEAVGKARDEGATVDVSNDSSVEGDAQKDVHEAERVERKAKS